MKTFAITGGIGSGKSTVCSSLLKRGVPVYDSDSAAKRLYLEDDSILDSIEGAFGRSVRTPGGDPDLKKIASIVFADPAKLKLLESIVHPAVLNDFMRWKASRYSILENEGPGDTFFGGEPFCVMESAIILEKPEFLAHVDAVVLVDAPLQARLERARARDRVDASEILRRMAAQKFDLSKVDVIIRNDGDLESLEKEISSAFKRLNGNI